MLVHRRECPLQTEQLAELDLLPRHIHRAVAERDCSREFVAFLRQLDPAYPVGMRIRLLLDNHSA